MDGQTKEDEEDMVLEDEKERGAVPCAEAAEAESSAVITSVTASDVLLGRGNGVKNWAGNLKYRDLIRINAHHYVDCQDRGKKDLIAHKVILQIEEPGGRFLKQISTEVEGSLMGAKWEKIPRDAALAKVRQALRDMAQISLSEDGQAGSNDGDNNNTASQLRDPLMLGNDVQMEELIRLVQVYRENSAIRYHRLRELVSTLETNLILSSRQPTFHGLSTMSTLDQLPSAMLSSNIDMMGSGERASLVAPVVPTDRLDDSSQRTGQLKHDDSDQRDTGAAPEQPSNLASLLGLVPRGGEGNSPPRFGSAPFPGAATRPFQNVAGQPSQGRESDRLLGELLADQRARSMRDLSSGLAGGMDSTTMRVDDISALQERARELSDRQRMLRQALTGTTNPSETQNPNENPDG